MKLKINAGLLSDLLSKVTPAIPTKSTLAILHNIYFSAKGGTLTLKGTDLDFSVALNHKMEIETDGEFLVSSSRLFSLIKTLPKHVDIELIYKDFVLHIKCKEIKFKSKIVTFNAMEFPNALEIEGQYSEFELNIDTFNSIGFNCVPFVSDDTGRASLNGVFFEVSEKITHFSGTDGHSACTLKINMDNDIEGRYIIGKKVFTYGKNNFSSGSIKIKVNDNLIQIESGELMVISKNIDGPPPNLLRLFENETTKTACVNVNDLQQAIKIVSSSSNKTTHKLEFNFKSEGVDISAVSTDDGADSNINVSLESYEGEEFKIGFSHRKLMAILPKINSDMVSIKMGNSLSQSFFIGSEQVNEERFLLMPLRLLE